MKVRLLVCAVLAAVSVTAFAESSWQYSREEDSMTGKVRSWASVESVNSLDLGFPYQGMNMGRLTVRQHPRYGLDVIFEIQKGQLICGIDRCSVLVRFDSAPPVSFEAVPPADHSSRALFLQPARKFVALAKKAHDIRVQATLYDNGNQVLQFHTAEPLGWPAK